MAQSPVVAVFAVVFVLRGRKRLGRVDDVRQRVAELALEIAGYVLKAHHRFLVDADIGREILRSHARDVVEHRHDRQIRAPRPHQRVDESLERVFGIILSAEKKSSSA